MKLLAIGELMIEMSHMDGNIYKRKFAGDTFNFLYYAKKFSPINWDLNYLTALGNDSISKELLDFIKKSGINTDSIIIHKTKTLGLFILSNLENGEKQYLYWRGQSAAKTVFNSLINLSKYDVIYFSGITAAIMENKENLIESIKNADKKLIYDLNHRKQLWSKDEAVSFSKKILPFCHFIKISDEEFDFLFPNMNFKDFSSRYPKAEIIYTCGAKNSQVWKNSKRVAIVESRKVKKIIDTSGAGDSFLGVYIVDRLKNESEVVSLHKANQLASYVVQEKGSLVDISNLDL